MLQELHVRDLALIEEVWLEFGPGMTVLSGETGAGKTALVGALGLLLGDRADSTMVRSGAKEALVEGRFLTGDEEFLVRRRVSSDGRSRCALGDEMATVALLAERLGPLVDLHGQHDHQALLSPATHVRCLDRYAGSPVVDALEGYRQAREAYTEAQLALDQLAATLADAGRQAEYLRFVVNEIEAAAPEVGEDESLEGRLPALLHADKLSAATSDAFAALRGDGGVTDSLSVGLAALTRVAGLDPALDQLADRLVTAMTELDDLGIEIREYANGLEHDPRALDEVQARLSALAGLKKKYGPSLEDVARTCEQAVERLGLFDAGEDAMERAREAVDSAAALLRSRAGELDRLRRAAAPEFETALTQAAVDLAMTGARFEVAFTELPFESWTASGPSRVEFLYVPAPAEAARPLAKVASGGEISRVMLALKSVLGEADTTPVLVFDEIDVGVGGATATAVGKRLADLAVTHQVLVITHLAQVAVFADRHLVVSKGLEGGRAATSVVAVNGEQRVGEIARMLSGADTEASRAHALELLEAAEDDRAVSSLAGD